MNKNKINMNINMISMVLLITFTVLGTLTPVSNSDRNTGSTYILSGDNNVWDRLLKRSVEYTKTDIEGENLSVYTIVSGKDKPIPLEEFLNWEERYEYAVLSREGSIGIDENINGHFLQIKEPSLEPIVLLLEDDKRIAIRYGDKYLKRNKFRGYEDDFFYNGYKKENGDLTKLAYVDSSGKEIIPLGDFENSDEVTRYYKEPMEEEGIIKKLQTIFKVKTNSKEIIPEEADLAIKDITKEVGGKIKDGTLGTEKENKKKEDEKKKDEEKKKEKEEETKKEEEEKNKSKTLKDLEKNKEKIGNEKEDEKEESGDKEIVKEETTKEEKEEVVKSGNIDSAGDSGNTGSVEDSGNTNNEIPPVTKPTIKTGEYHTEPRNTTNVHGELIKDIYGGYDIHKRAEITPDLKGLTESIGLTDIVEFEVLSPRQLKELSDTMTLEDIENAFKVASKYNLVNKDDIEVIMKERINGSTKEELTPPINDTTVPNVEGGTSGGTQNNLEDMWNNIQIGDQNDTPLWNLGDYYGQEDVELGVEDSTQNTQGGVNWGDFESGVWESNVASQGGSCYDLKLSTSEMNRCLVEGYNNYIDKTPSSYNETSTSQKILTGEGEVMETSQQRELDKRVASGIKRNHSQEDIMNMSDSDFSKLVEGTTLTRESLLEQGPRGIVEENLDAPPLSKTNNPLKSVYGDEELTRNSEGSEDDLMATAYTDINPDYFDENFNKIDSNAWSFEPPEQKELKFITYEIEEKEDYETIVYSSFLMSLVMIGAAAFRKSSKLQMQMRREDFKSSMRFKSEEIEFMDIMDKDLMGGDSDWK